MIINVVASRESSLDFFRFIYSFIFISTRKQDNKFISTLAGNNGSFINHRQHALTYCNQKLITYTMTEDVVNILEAIQIDKQERHLRW